MTRARRDPNRVPTLIGVSSSTTGDYTQDETPVAVRVDPTTKRLYVDASISSATITDIEDGAGDSVMDATNDAVRVNLVASSGSMAVTNAGLTELAAAINASSQMDVNIAASGATVPVSIAASVTVDTELPAAAALSDAIGNPTAPMIGAGAMGWNGDAAWERLRCDIGDDAVSTGLQNVVGMMFDGSTYDRMRGDSANGLLVNLGTNNDVGLNAGTNAVGKLLPPDIDVTAHTNYARKYYTSAGAATDGIIWSPGAGKRWHVLALYFHTSAAATITFEDDKAGGDDPVLKGEYAANGGAFLVFPDKYPFASGEDAADLTVTTSAGNIYVAAVGYEV